MHLKKIKQVEYFNVSIQNTKYSCLCFQCFCHRKKKVCKKYEVSYILPKPSTTDLLANSNISKPMGNAP